MLAAFNELLKIKEKKENLPVGSNKVPDFREKDEYDMDNFKTINIGNTNKGITKMKIKLSKSQWEIVGRKAGWMKKKAEIALPRLNGTVTFSTYGAEQARATGSTPVTMHIKTPMGEWQILINETQDPDLRSIYDEIMSNFGTDVKQAMKQRRQGQGAGPATSAGPTPAAAPSTPTAQPNPSFNRGDDNYSGNVEDNIRKNYLKVDWKEVSKNQKLTEDFIREFKDFVYWPFIARYQNLSQSFKEEFRDMLSMSSNMRTIKQDPSEHYTGESNPEEVDRLRKLVE